MKVRIAISKRRAKTLAAAVIYHSADFGRWHQVFYTVCMGKAGPFGLQGFDTLEEAVADACETMKTRPEDFIEMQEEDVENYILKNSRNKWDPSQYKRVRRAQQEI